MINYSKNLINLPFLYVSLLRKLRYQRKFIQDTLLVDIQESKSTNDHSLNDQDYKKITGYYGLAVPVLFGESYCVLRGKGLSPGERMALTYLGGLTGLFDDFFDKKDFSESYILNLLENADTHPGNNSYEQLILRFYRKVLDTITNPGFKKEQFMDVFHAQIESKKQKSDGITADELNAITLHKGGVSTLLFRNIFSDTLPEGEKILFFKLGGLFQLENDIFDVYKDYTDGIRTLVTIEKSMNHLRNTYISLQQEIFMLVQQTGYSTKNKKSFKRIVYLIFCRGLVCLDQLEKKEKLTGNVFDIEKYQRRDLICDMEKPVNIIRLHHYFLKYNFDSNN